MSPAFAQQFEDGQAWAGQLVTRITQRPDAGRVIVVHTINPLLSKPVHLLYHPRDKLTFTVNSEKFVKFALRRDLERYSFSYKVLIPNEPAVHNETSQKLSLVVEVCFGVRVQALCD